MPTDLKRYMVSFDDDVLKLLIADCEKNKKKVGTKINHIVKEYYHIEIKQPMIFGRDQPLAKQSPSARPLVFRAPAPPALAPGEVRHESNGQGKS